MKAPSDQWVPLGCFDDQYDCLVYSVQKARRCCGRVVAIPLKGGLNLAPRELSDADAPHLPKLLPETLFQLGPGFTVFRISVRFSLAAIQFGGKRVRHGSGVGRIQTVPEAAHQLDALFWGQFLYTEVARCHAFKSEACLHAAQPFWVFTGT